MPGKGHRTASRQAQLKRNRKGRKAREPRRQEFDAGPDESRAVVATAVEEAEGEAPAGSQAVATAQAQSAPARQSRRRARQSGSIESALVYKHLGKELKYIAAIASVIIAVLIGLTFLLGN